MSKIWRFGIVGCGRIAHRHAEQIKRFGHLYAVCDIIPEKADAFAKQYNALAYYTSASLLLQQQSIDIGGLPQEHSL